MALRVWGPVEEARALEVGALAAAASVLLRPTQLPVDILRRLQDEVPKEVLPAADDTADTLRDRLAKSAFLHESWVLRKGNGKGGYVRLNSTKYSQPRRVRWSRTASGEFTDEDGERCVDGLAYPHYYTRSPLDVTCEPMPASVQDLTEWAYNLASPYLAPGSRNGAPNAVELCLYYTAFESKMGRHRDNFESKDLANYLRSGNGDILSAQQNTQVANSSVLIWSMGNAPMELQLSFPPHVSLAGDRKSYKRAPDFCVPCGNGTLFVFSPLDDLFYAHEVCFSSQTLDEFGDSGYRTAFVMRWLDATVASKTFHASGEKRGMLKADAQATAQEAKRMKSLREQRRKKTRIR